MPATRSSSEASWSSACSRELISRTDSYAYEIASRLAAEIGMGEGTIYPLMRRLQSDGLLEDYLVDSPAGPPRRGTTGSRRRGMRGWYRSRGVGMLSGSIDRIVKGDQVSRAEFILRLKTGLRGLSAEASAEILADYESYFAEGAQAGRAEAELTRALGDPSRLAAELRLDFDVRRWQQDRSARSAVRMIAGVLSLGVLDLLVLAPLVRPRSAACSGSSSRWASSCSAATCS